MITRAKFCSVGFPERKREQFATFKSAHLLMKHGAIRRAQTDISSVFFFLRGMQLGKFDYSIYYEKI